MSAGTTAGTTAGTMAGTTAGTTARSTRPVRAEDAEGLLLMQQAHQRAVLGRPDATLDDIRDQLADPDLDPASPVVLDADGSVLGCAMVFPGAAHVEMDVVVDPVRAPDLFPTLLDRGVAIAAAAVRARGDAVVRVDQGCYRQDEQTAAALQQAGFAPATTFRRMRRPLDEPIAVTVPDGVALERVDVETDDALRRAHRLHTSTFAGHFGFEPRSYGDWLAGHRARTGMGPLWFATLDGEDVGFLHETDQFVEDEGAGYVLRLGVEKAARGRGVAKALLLSAFAGMRERGRGSALLHVDSANATGATRLYESVGMTPVVVIDVWRAELPVGEG
jgi:mycothiol synthase